MKKIILIILLYFSIINIAYAIPVPALLIGWDFIILAIPAILGIFSAVYFYFKKYIFWINIYLLFLVIFLYFFHLDLTEEIFFFDNEYLLFGFLFILFGFIYKFKKINFLNYILILLLIVANFFLVKIDYNLYQFKQITNKVEKNMYSNIQITKILYKDNFVAIYYKDIETNFSGYSIIGIGKGLEHCSQKGKYNICNSGNKFLNKGVSNLIYKILNKNGKYMIHSGK